MPDTSLHTWIGWVLVGLAVVGLVFGARAVRTFVIASVRFSRHDLAT